MTPPTPEPVTLTDEEVKALEWARQREIACYCGCGAAMRVPESARVLANAIDRLRRAPSAEVVAMEAKLAKVVLALNGMQEFHDCMEAQRKDEPLPEGHDEPDEACGDGVCYRVGDIIKRGVEVAREVTAALAAAKETK